MEKLEIKLVNNFICDVARFIEHKDNKESENIQRKILIGIL